MVHWRMLLLLLLLAGSILGGCQAPCSATRKEPPAADTSASTDAASRDTAKKPTTSKASEKIADSATAVAADQRTDKKSAAANDAANAQALQELMGEVSQLGVLDPVEQKRLLEDLRQTDPALWPMMVRQVRAAVAYRRKSLEPARPAQQDTMLAAASTESAINAGDSREDRRVASRSAQRLNDSKQFAAGPPSGASERAVKTAKSTLSVGCDEALAIEYLPDAAAVITPRGRASDDARAAPRESRDVVDMQALDEERRITPVSYERPSAQDGEPGRAAAPTKAASGAKAVAGGDSSPADWHGSLAQTIKALEAEVPEQPKTADDFSKQARLRILYALAGRREDAAKPIPSAPPAMQDFWAKELYGLSVLLDTERQPDAMSRAAEARQHLGEAYARLGQAAPLLVRSLSFCTEVQSYGCCTPFKNYEFLPGQEVLLYAEIENFGVESTAKGYHTALRSSYQILDKGGQRIADHAISTTEEHCQNPRRDFFIGYQLRMPPRINPGKYTLQLMIEDLKSQKVGQASVELTIKGGELEKAAR
jgi:hypothetical protein